MVNRALPALKFSNSSSPSAPPSTVYAQSQPNRGTLMLCAPRPISSSGLKAILTLPCSISGCACKYATAEIISAMPALSSAPSSVCPSVTIRSCPLYAATSGKSFTVSTMPSFSPNVMSLPSYEVTTRGRTSLPLMSGLVSRCEMNPITGISLSLLAGSVA